jgi:adenylate kinase
MEPRIVVLMGPPGSGKGTQAKLAAHALGIPHISTGDMLRRAVADQSDLGSRVKTVMESGQLVSDDLMIEVVKKRLEQADCRVHGAILDGYPRTLQQARDLESILGSGAARLTAINLYVGEDILRRRMIGRRSCGECGKVYNIFENPSPSGLSCGECGSELIQRPDDKDDVVSARLVEYAAKTEPLLGYYKKLDLLHVVDGDKDVSVVHKEIIQLIGPS